MKKIIFVLSLLLVTSIVTAQFTGSSNHSINYCRILGYEVFYDSVTNMSMVVLPDGSRENTWEFYRGVAGKEFSYCVKKGYELRTKLKKSGKSQLRLSYCYNPETGEEKWLKKLMYDEGDYSKLFYTGAPPPGDSLPPPEEPDPPENPGDPDPPDIIPGEPLFFDWRNVDGVDYLNPVGYQDECGACYAFASTAVAEVAYYCATGEKKDFSEAFIAFNGQCSYPGILQGCIGQYDYYNTSMTPLIMHCQEGTILESDFSYGPGQQPCVEDYYDNTRFRFHSYGSINSGTIAEIKQIIREKGPLYTAGYNGGWDGYEAFDVEGDTIIYTESLQHSCHDAYQYPHAVCIVGYGYQGGTGGAGDYWIVRESQGEGLGDYGYMYVRATDSKLTCFMGYLKWKEPSVEGDYFVGENLTNYYSIVNYQNSVESFSWSVEPTNFFNVSSGSTAIVYLDPVSGAKGPANITFTLTHIVGYDPDATEQYTIPLWVGPPSTNPDEPEIEVEYTNNDPCEPLRVYKTEFDLSYYQADEIEWSVEPGSGLTITGSDDQRNCWVNVGYPGGTLYCTISNPAGPAPTVSVEISFECPYMMAFPNPADDIIDIEVDEIEEDSDIETSLYNSKGEKRKEKKTKAKKHSLDVSDLPTGTYYLKVKVKNKDGQDVILEETIVII